MKTVAIDFDGVIHQYSKGWQDGSIYDPPVAGAFDAIENLILRDYSVFIFTSRSPSQVKKWMIQNTYESEYAVEGMGGDPSRLIYPKYGFTVEKIPLWVNFWNKQNVVGVTSRKLPAIAYIDDRAICFRGSWYDTLSAIENFETYQSP